MPNPATTVDYTADVTVTVNSPFLRNTDASHHSLSVPYYVFLIVSCKPDRVVAHVQTMT